MLNTTFPHPLPRSGEALINSDATTETYTHSQPPYQCPGSPTSEDMLHTYAAVYFWLEVVLQFVIGIAGFIANMAVIPILCCEELKGIFNRLLATLVVADNCFIALSLVNTARIHFFPESDAFHTVGNRVLFPLRSTFLCATIYVVTALAVERYRAIRHPISYYKANKGTNVWCKVLTKYLLPVVAVAIGTNIPRFLEMIHSGNIIQEEGMEGIETGNVFEIYATKNNMEYSNLRFDRHYILWYQNVAKLLLTAVIPFMTLIYINAQVYIVIQRRRKHIGRRFLNPESNACKAKAARQAHILFAICFMFFIGHFPRIFLDIHELIALEDYHHRKERNCLPVPLWAMVAGSVSQVLLVLNCSVNFAIYCWMSREFRQIFSLKASKILNSLLGETFPYRRSRKRRETVSTCGGGGVPTSCFVDLTRKKMQRQSSRAEVLPAMATKLDDAVAETAESAVCSDDSGPRSKSLHSNKGTSIVVQVTVHTGHVPGITLCYPIKSNTISEPKYVQGGSSEESPRRHSTGSDATLALRAGRWRWRRTTSEPRVILPTLL